uniref:Uncharacterized protein n=1 Tax=Cacopsylla melanoneura TaxID=428564 RepID=A0A8D9AQD5_9HEMI
MMAESTKSFKKGCVLSSQAREIVLNVYKFMQGELKDGVKLLNKVQARVAEATGVSVRSIQRISSQNAAKGKLATPNKKLGEDRNQYLRWRGLFVCLFIFIISRVGKILNKKKHCV